MNSVSHLNLYTSLSPGGSVSLEQFGSERPGPLPHIPQAPREEAKVEEKADTGEMQRQTQKGKYRKIHSKKQQTAGIAISPHTRGPPVGP